jgi:hypothetical protein
VVPVPIPIPAPTPTPSVRTPSPRPPTNPNPDPNPSDSSSSDSDDLQDGNNPPHPLRVPPGGRPYVEPIQVYSLGPMDTQCSHCHALHFISEKLSNSSLCNPHFGMCCLQGQVRFPDIQSWPRVLQDLFDDLQDHREFKKRIRQYNNAMAFTSVDVEMGNEGIQGAGPISFRIHGALHQLMGARILPNDQQPSSAQLYIYDPVEATDRWVQHNHQLDGVYFWICMRCEENTILMLQSTNRPMRS